MLRKGPRVSRRDRGARDRRARAALDLDARAGADLLLGVLLARATGAWADRRAGDTPRGAVSASAARGASGAHAALVRAHPLLAALGRRRAHGGGFRRDRVLAPARGPVSYTHLRAHETDSYLVCRLLL